MSWVALYQIWRGTHPQLPNWNWWQYCHDIIGIPLDTCSSAILFSIASIYYFRIQTTIPSWRGVLGINISNLDGNWPPQGQKMAIFYTPSCQTEVDGHIVHDIMWILLTSLLGKLLGTFPFFVITNYNFYIHQYCLCNKNFPVILIKNCHSKGIVIPGPKCIYLFLHRLNISDFIMWCLTGTYIWLSACSSQSKRY